MVGGSVWRHDGRQDHEATPPSLPRAALILGLVAVGMGLEKFEGGANDVINVRDFCDPSELLSHPAGVTGEPLAPGQHAHVLVRGDVGYVDGFVVAKSVRRPPRP